MHRLKFQLWCVAFPSFPGCSGFFLFGNPEYFLGDSPLTILCSDHLCLCSGSNLNGFEDRDNTRFTVLLPETSMALGMCFINMDLMRKMSCFSLNTSSSKSEKFSAGEIVGNYSFLAVNLTYRFPPISSLDQIKLTKCWIWLAFLSKLSERVSFTPPMWGRMVEDQENVRFWVPEDLIPLPQGIHVCPWEGSGLSQAKELGDPGNFV